MQAGRREKYESVALALALALARVFAKRKRPQPAEAPDVLAAKDPNFPISMGHGWAERMVVLGPPGPQCSSASDMMASSY